MQASHHGVAPKTGANGARYANFQGKLDSLGQLRYLVSCHRHHRPDLLISAKRPSKAHAGFPRELNMLSDLVYTETNEGRVPESDSVTGG
jgi:hypothetical protein